MQSSTNPPTTFNMMAKSIEIIRQHPSAWLRTGFWMIFIPYLLLILIQGWRSGHISDQLHSIPMHTYQDLLNVFSPFLFFFLISCLLFLMFALTGFLSFIHLAVWAFQEKPFLSFTSAMQKSLRILFPGGLVFLCSLGLLSFEQIFFGPFRILTLCASMACVIMVVEEKKALTALKHALFLKYSSPAAGGAIATAMVMFGLSAIVFTGEHGISWICQLILRGDEWMEISRALWMLTLPGTPMTAIYLLVSAIAGVSLAIMLAFIASYMVCLFFRVRSSVNHLV